MLNLEDRDISIIVNINEREYLMLQYADHDKLYIPVKKLDRISKYVSNT